MNMQAMLKQAQALQKDMMKAKDEIDNTEFDMEKLKNFEQMLRNKPEHEEVEMLKLLLKMDLIRMILKCLKI